MIELLFVACLASSDGQDCREQSLIFTDITPMMCMMGAQPQLARWAATHPDHTIKSWKCRAVTFTEMET